MRGIRNVAHTWIFETEIETNSNGGGNADDAVASERVAVVRPSTTRNRASA